MNKRAKALLLILALAFAGFVNVQLAPKALAAPALAPFTTRSYYVDYNFNVKDTNGNYCPECYALGLGEADAQAENNELVQRGLHCTQAEYIDYTILDFGSPRSTYTGTFTGHTIPYGTSQGDVANIVADYATGWYTYSYNCFILDLIVGVSNSYICGNAYETQPCDGQAGNALANDVNNVNIIMANVGYAWQILGKGGFDAEAYWDSVDTFGSYASTNDFAQGYNQYLFNNGKSWNLYDFGAAGSTCSGPDADWCTNGELAAHVYNIAWGIGYDEPFPEAYNTNAGWQSVDSYSSSGGASQGHIQYSTVMLDGSQSNSADCTDWNDFVSQNAGYIPNSPFYASVQQPLDSAYKGFFYC